MSNGLREGLERRKRAIAETAAREMLRDASVDSESLEEIARIDKVLAALPPARASLPVLPLVIGVASVVLVSLTWLMPIHALGLRTVVHLEAEAGSASLTPEAPVHWRLGVAASPPETRITAASVAGWSGLPSDATVAILRADDITLDSVTVPAGGRLSLSKTDAGPIDLTLHGGGAKALLLVAGRGEFDEHRFDHPVPETVQLGTGSASKVPSVLTFSPAKPLHLRAIPVSAVRFGIPDGTGGFVSSLHGATIRLPQTGRVLNLRKQDAIRLEGLKGRIVSLQAGPDMLGVSLILKGTAQRVFVEEAGLVRATSPSILNYIFENQRLTFLFGAFSALWGLLWSGKRLFFS